MYYVIYNHIILLKLSLIYYNQSKNVTIIRLNYLYSSTINYAIDTKYNTSYHYLNKYNIHFIPFSCPSTKTHLLFNQIK